MKMSVEIPPLMRQSLSSLCVVLFCFVFSLPFMKSEGAAPSAETDAKIGPVYYPLAVYGVQHLQFGAFRVIGRRAETVIQINAEGDELPYKAKNYNRFDPDRSAVVPGKFVVEGQWARNISVTLQVVNQLGYVFRIGDGLLEAVEENFTDLEAGDEVEPARYDAGGGAFEGGFVVNSGDVIDKMTQLPSTFTIQLPGIDSPSPGTLAFSFGGMLTIEDSTTLPPPSENLAKVKVTIIFN